MVIERMNALKTILYSIVLFIAKPSNSFPPDENGLTGSAANTKHHKEITSFAIQMAVVTYIQINNLSVVDDSSDPSTKLQDFFGDDADGLQEFNRRKDEIIQHVKNQEKSNEAHIHCNSEQIEFAHNYIIKLRGQIKDLALSTEPDLTLIREKIGKCIFTLQSFYSGTNWVEMNNIATYRDFGVPNKTLMAIAGKSLDTCQDCDNSGSDKNSCKNNLLITNMLTSGYKTGQDIQPPYKVSGDKDKGKCGYGGSVDSENGQTTALGGINKDRPDSTYSPHHYLHYDAFFAARTATVNFLIDEEIGIINELQEDVFADVFNIVKRYKASFGFVIDNTGSMRNDIVAVRKACVDIITDVLGTPNEPTEYVLVTFNDPETDTILQLKTPNGTDMINTLNDLDVYGGEDCQEYAISGLSKGIEECKENSKIFFFTDAPAKDEVNREVMTEAAALKNIEIFEMLRTPLCPWEERKKRESGRAKREIVRETEVYYLIADETGGQVYEITIDELASLTRQLTQKLFPSATAIVTFLTLGSSDDDSVSFNVDKTMNNVKITVIGAYSTDNVAISSPFGSVFTTENANTLFESPDKVVITIVQPTPGVYTLTRTGDNPWNINITAQTAVDFDFTLTEIAEDGYLYKMEGNPILGETYTIFVTIYNLPEDLTVKGMLLTTENQELVHLNLRQLESEFDSIYIVSLNLTAESYQISIYGTDNGTNWMRTSSNMINPVHVKLIDISAPDLYVNMISNVSYRVENKGPENETFDVMITDNRGLLIGQTTFTRSIATGESQEIIFQVQGSSEFKTVTYDITVNKTGSILQQMKKTIYISQDIPPVCSVDKQSGNCDNTYTNGSCSDVTWNAQATITFVTELKSITGSIGLNIDYESSISTPMKVNVSGDCCIPSAYLSIIDENSNFARCHFYLGEVIYIENKSNSVLSTSEKIAIGVVAGIVVACIVAISIFLILVYRGAIRPKLDALKIDTINIRASKDFPEQKDYSPKERFHDDFSALKNDFYNHLVHTLHKEEI
ncbi:von Willebrand factor A domain-containing protein 7-like isoform X2 [Mytilus edulis]|uniref:von Willebrand factor A domain-containing protein 7-like isoform X2 n=1 Tax=Mytilus edulis TaxID=6550 RepID=UPI0039EF5E1D